MILGAHLTNSIEVLIIINLITVGFMYLVINYSKYNNKTYNTKVGIKR